MTGSGIFCVVVGASGVGKDTLLAGAWAALREDTRFAFAQRVITRPENVGTEGHESVGAEEFEALMASGALVHGWKAHGLSYGWRTEQFAALAQGGCVIANGSRADIPALREKFANLVVIEITARDETIARRLATRGRENAQAIASRLARKPLPMPADVSVFHVSNDTDVQSGVNALVATIRAIADRPRLRRVAVATGRGPVVFLPGKATDAPPAHRLEIQAAGRSLCAQAMMCHDPSVVGAHEIGVSDDGFRFLGLPEATPVLIARAPAPPSRSLLQQRIAGHVLRESEYENLFRDIVNRRYSDAEVAALLVSIIPNMSIEETARVARARASLVSPMTWPEKMVVDKHSLGGVPGSRITLVVVPIVAAYGLLIPKTSSRAITSASGTAEAMETVARVDLGMAEMEQVVARTGGCIAWNGRLMHSPLDDIVNDLTRPLNLETNRWSVASILSKKLIAGSTHVMIDIPYGPFAKVHDLDQATLLAELFEAVGDKMGLRVGAMPTDGSRPIGRGIGPALELRDARAVLAEDPAAPPDMREKALCFAAEIIAFDPNVPTIAAAHEIARDILRSGAALAKFEDIIHAQGPRVPAVAPGPVRLPVRAGRAGVVRGINGWRIATLARRAGAPTDLSAGLDLHASVGDRVEADTVVFTLMGSSLPDVQAAAHMAASAGVGKSADESSKENGFDIREC
ncbi:phosphonate metabolism protein/1,5-bisphosphokinase (PRPP-forming) PhnN [Acetobacter sp. TBRC 12305]|uniref:Bifunctional ribose 1,5-bisphosphokinase-thymidine phosphorylase n=1 Tax=Acetobacter garciniae TaxID=2817435 RepID=A0A939HQD2_9PROT|nr:phosphonate metabolism protein/1,5-bisphosphokinase (PRPP-forming) PhnN [Acetobacter garciniae]MBO1325516.1 phosphonate metabolism protein/1,5-bisphosphokinase (PRPP-forming) PhnN [Acetobacter garciniae]MBX0345312.1 phosphonate metabolism protein/1,5-bisphosphokinase (PRPP-forming) PhnN [Acetobacter garciniae]